MKIVQTLFALLGGMGLCALPACSKAPDKVVSAPGAPVPEAAWVAQARAAYPLKTCVVSDDALGSMGANVDYVYQAPGGQPRLVVFCCAACIEEFNKEPAKYLAMVDAAAAKK